MMFVRKNRLGMALTLESHLNELRSDILSGGLSALVGKAGDKQISRITKHEESCYICGRIEYNFTRVLSNVIYLWKNDPEFRIKYAVQPYFCLPHYKRLLETGKKELDKKKKRIEKLELLIEECAQKREQLCAMTEQLISDFSNIRSIPSVS